jgi:hypothetical protein
MGLDSSRRDGTACVLFADTTSGIVVHTILAHVFINNKNMYLSRYLLWSLISSFDMIVVAIDCEDRVMRHMILNHSKFSLIRTN